MLYKLLILMVALGAVVAAPEPPQKKTYSSNNDVMYFEYPGYEISQAEPPTILDIISSIIGYKASALTIAVSVIEWAVSNFYFILIGVATAFGFCKITGKCSMNYEQYIPVSQLQGLVTPENIETAERLFITAVEKYAERKKRAE